LDTESADDSDESVIDTLWGEFGSL
jgi:hypothetical protein